MTEDRPKIADKVMFWQEQDRINQELIPRVLKQHELFSTHVENHDDATSQIAALEARLTATINAWRRNALLVSGLSLVVAVVAVILAVVT